MTKKRVYTEAQVEKVANDIFENDGFIRRRDRVIQSVTDNIPGAQRSMDAFERARHAAVGSLSLARFRDRGGDDVELRFDETDSEVDNPGVHPATLTRTGRDGEQNVIDGYVLTDRISTREDRKDFTPFQYVEAGAVVLVGLAAVAGTLLVVHRQKKN